jgi:hypothetical protein
MVASLLVFRLFSVDEEEDADEEDTLEHVDEADEWRNAWLMGMADEVVASLAIRAAPVAVVGL